MAITFQIVGHKNSGKTLVTTKLISALTAQGWRVAAIKHDAHTGAMDVPGTDSDLMSRAGAHQVVRESSQGLFYHQQAPVPPLSFLVNRLRQKNDLVVIEGHKAANYSKLVMLAPDETLKTVPQAGVVATASLTPNPAAELVGLEQTVNWCLDYLIRRQEEGPQP